MARNLFIRVSAVTYDEKEVPRAWPMLYAAVWPDPGVAGAESPAKLARKLIPARERGVLELADAFVEHIQYGEIPQGIQKGLQTAAKQMEENRKGLDDALGNRDAQQADAFASKIEDTLDEAEKIMREQ